MSVVGPSSVVVGPVGPVEPRALYELRDFSLPPRELSADDAVDYFVNYWLGRGIERATLFARDRNSFDRCLDAYADDCVKRLGRFAVRQTPTKGA